MCFWIEPSRVANNLLAACNWLIPPSRVRRAGNTSNHLDFKHPIVAILFQEICKRKLIPGRYIAEKAFIKWKSCQSLLSSAE
jgi:hypothetical protein